MSNLTDLLPAGAGGKQVSFVASGTIGNGVTVGLNADGTVEAVGTISIPEETGSAVVFNGSSYWFGAAFDSNENKVVIVYSDQTNGSYGTAIVGTVSGTSISFGTKAIFESASSQYVAASFDTAANKVVISYRDDPDSSQGKAVVATVSGTSISFGSPVTFSNTAATYISCVYDSSQDKTVIVYCDDQNSYQAKAVVGTVSGTSISFGSPVTFNAATTYDTRGVFDPSNNKVIIAYRDAANSNYGTAIVGTVSGTSISFGSESVFNAGNLFYISIVYDSIENKIIISYTDFGNSAYGASIVGTVSGTSISFGSEIIFLSAATQGTASSFDPNANKVVVFYRKDDANDYGYSTVGTVSGTSVSFATPSIFKSSVVSDIMFSTFDSNENKVIIVYQDQSNASSGTVNVFRNASTATNSADFIGISDAAISDTASGSVTIKGGISTNVTGLTANALYYVQADGTLATTTSTVLAGKALSSTSINLDYTT